MNIRTIVRPETIAKGSRTHALGAVAAIAVVIASRAMVVARRIALFAPSSSANGRVASISLRPSRRDRGTAAGGTAEESLSVWSSEQVAAMASWAPVQFGRQDF